MIKESFELIKNKYEKGVYSLKEMCFLVELKIITIEEFNLITSYNYEGIKKSKGW